MVINLIGKAQSNGKIQCALGSSGGSKGGREGRTPPLGVQILSISCSFWENLAKLCVHAPPLEGSRPPLGEILDPSLGSLVFFTKLAIMHAHTRH